MSILSEAAEVCPDGVASIALLGSGAVGVGMELKGFEDGGNQRGQMKCARHVSTSGAEFSAYKRLPAFEDFQVTSKSSERRWRRDAV